jgi:hypothetical protein
MRSISAWCQHAEIGSAVVYTYFHTMSLTEKCDGISPEHASVFALTFLCKNVSVL